MTTPVTRFEAFTSEHLVLLVGFVVVCFALTTLGRSHRGTAREVRFRRAYALLIPCFTVPMQVLQLLPGDFDFAKSLPLQLCDFAWIAAVVALWTRHWAATALVYFWGLTLTIQGIITPSLTDLFPHPQYFMFWGMHFFTVWAAVYLTFGLGVRPSWRSFRFTVAATAVWAGTVMTFNALTGTNYGYLNRKPAVGTLLDFFGPWPGYVVVEIALVAGVWALMTWPWTRAERPAHLDVHGTGRAAAIVSRPNWPHAERRGSCPATTTAHRVRALDGVATTRKWFLLNQVGVVLATGLIATACGNQSTDGDRPADQKGSGSGATSQAPTARAREHLTAAGIAAVVEEHLGASNVVRFGSYGDEPGTVGVMARLRGGAPADNFAVTVYSPKSGGAELGEATTCPRGRQAKRDPGMKEFTCHQLPNGTTVTSYRVPYGFSDDNAHGQVITGMAGAPDRSVAIAMYESYDRSAPISVTDIDHLLSDPRLAWMTDPAVNTAGKDLKIHKLRG